MSKHEAQCTVCKHSDRKRIEHRFVNWTSRTVLEQEYELPRDSLYRHAKAKGLYAKRQNNLVGALETIIERGLSNNVDVTTTNVIEAIKSHAKLTGQWVDRREDVTAQLERATDEELSFYALHGRIPDPGELDASDDTEH